MKSKTKELEPKKELTQAEVIWNEIKDLDLFLYALPNQFVHKYCKPFPLDPSKLYLEYNARTHGIILPLLEEAIKMKYNVEPVDRFLMITVKS